MSNAADTGILVVKDGAAEKRLPCYDTAELIRNDILRAGTLTYKDGTVMASKRIYVAFDKLEAFKTAIAAGNVTFQAKPVTKFVSSSNLKRNA